MRSQLSFRSSVLLASCSIMLPGLAAANPNFYGNVTPGLLYSVAHKIDPTSTDTASVCGMVSGKYADCSVSKEQKYTSFDHNSYTTKVGMNYQVSEKVMTSFELGSDLKSSATEPFGESTIALTARTYYFGVDLGFGTLLVGRQTRPFSGVANAADNMKFVFNGTTPGTTNLRRNLGVSLKSNELFGMLNVHVAVVNAAKPGTIEVAENTEMPTLDASAQLSLMKNFNVSLGLINEGQSARNTDGKNKSYDTNAYAVGVAGNLPGLKGNLTYTMGDAPFKNATKLAATTKNKKDKVSGINLWLETQVNALHLGGFYGMETGALSKETHLDKAGKANDVKEIATAFGLHVGYDWNDVEWIFEYATQENKYDKVTVSKRDWIGLAANLNWAS